MAVVLLVTGALVHRALHRRWLATWDGDWLATGLRWNPQRQDLG